MLETFEDISSVVKEYCDCRIHTYATVRRQPPPKALLGTPDGDRDILWSISWLIILISGPPWGLLVFTVNMRRQEEKLR